MRSLVIPGTDLTVSALCFGAGGLGTRVSEDDSFRLLDLFLERGGNFLDTAHIYAAWVPGGGGVSERTIGAWVRERGVRDRVVIGTKGGHPHLESMHVSRLSPAEIRQDLEESLERLQVDRVDFYWLHRDDPARPVGEMVDTLAVLAGEGRLRAYGVSNWSPARTREAVDYAAARGLPPVRGNQVGWSLAVRNADAGGDPTVRFMDEETHAYHRATGLFAAAYSSQANGFFAGEYGRDLPSPAPKSGAGVVRAYYSESNFRRLDRARELAARRGCAPNDIALGYLLSQSFPTCAIVGCGTEEHLRSSLRAADIQLTPEEVAWLTA
jgi:aryl-alcohol dehydrogenase-like predicted oxidoreductase